MDRVTWYHMDYGASWISSDGSSTETVEIRIFNSDVGPWFFDVWKLDHGARSLPRWWQPIWRE